MDYYAGLRLIELDKTPASKMPDDGGLIRLWEKADEYPPALVKGFESGKITTYLLPLVTNALQTLLNTIFITKEEPRYVSLSDFEDRMNQLADPPTDKKREKYTLCTIRRLVLALKDLQTYRSLHDHELYDEHPDCSCSAYEEEPSGPFDWRESRRNFSAALHGYFNQHGNPLTHFETALDDLERQPTDDPRPFINWQYDYSDEIRDLLSTPVSFYYDDPVGQIVFDDPSTKGVERISKWIFDAKNKFCIKLCNYFDDHADASPADSLARKPWIASSALRSWPQRRNGSSGDSQKKSKPTLADLMERQIQLSQSIVQNTGRSADANEKMLTMEEKKNKLSKPEENRAVDWSKCKKRPPRFICDENYANVMDRKHTEEKGFPHIKPYTNTPEAAQAAIKALIEATGHNRKEHNWWIQSRHTSGTFAGKSFSGAFQGKGSSAYEFKRFQIEVGTQNNHKGKWRIRPDRPDDTLFKKNYDDKRPHKDALAGS